MTSLFSRPCQCPGCHSYAVKGEAYCAEHLKQNSRQQDVRRGTRTQRGYSNAWLRARKAYITAHPLCVECLKKGKLTPATDVDHIIPHKGDKNLFWNENNWQSLCHECHSRKTATEDGGFGNAITPRGSPKY